MAEKAAAEKAAAENAATAENAAAEMAAAVEKAAAIGLLQPLEALSLDQSDFLRLTAAISSFCEAQGAGSVAELVERASKLSLQPKGG